MSGSLLSELHLFLFSIVFFPPFGPSWRALIFFSSQTSLSFRVSWRPYPSSPQFCTRFFFFFCWPLPLFFPNPALSGFSVPRLFQTSPFPSNLVGALTKPRISPLTSFPSTRPFSCGVLGVPFFPSGKLSVLGGPRLPTPPNKPVPSTSPSHLVRHEDFPHLLRLPAFFFSSIKSSSTPES